MAGHSITRINLSEETVSNDKIIFFLDPRVCLVFYRATLIILSLILVKHSAGSCPTLICCIYLITIDIVEPCLFSRMSRTCLAWTFRLKVIGKKTCLLGETAHF